jgi:hypothetical protein
MLDSINASTNAKKELVEDEWLLRIKSFKDVEIRVESHSSVSQVKQQVRAALECGPDRYVRLICKGRLLAPDTAPLHEFAVQNNDVLHAVLASENEPRRRRGQVVGRGGRVTRAANEESSSSEDEDEEQGRERRGFDRLRTSGLSRQEITAIRTYFSRHVDRHVQSHPSDHADEPDLRRRRLFMEEDWMSLQGPTSEFRLNLNQNTLLRFASVDTQNWRSTLGTDRDFMWGFLLGFFVGFVMLVWVWMPTVPHKQKIGILTGISFQLAMNVMHQEQGDEFVEGD